jgi:hypothetical protein
VGLRRSYLFLIVFIVVLLFLAISAVLARVLSIDGAERSAITSLIQAEARGDAAAMRSQVLGCAQSTGCSVRINHDAAALRHPGSVTILEIMPSAGFSLTGSSGTARVAWQAGGSLPIVQCVRVHRAGNALSGLHVELLELSSRILSDSVCPSRL